MSVLRFFLFTVLISDDAHISDLSSLSDSLTLDDGKWAPRACF